MVFLYRGRIASYYDLKTIRFPSHWNREAVYNKYKQTCLDQRYDTYCSRQIFIRHWKSVCPEFGIIRSCRDVCHICYDNSQELALLFCLIGHLILIIVFSDGKIFTVEQAFYPQNDRILAEKGELGDHRVNRVQKLQSVMVWVAVTETKKYLLVFLSGGLKIYTNVYIRPLQ
uniref:Uncharacterized protein n=1 Tax=Lepeophtheirus salmonis TaxID=72036 RepID=A0A0K2VJZ9_LEPSM